MNSQISGNYTDFHALSSPHPSAPREKNSVPVRGGEVKYPQYFNIPQDKIEQLNTMLRKAGKVQQAAYPTIESQEDQVSARETKKTSKTSSSALGSAASVIKYAPTTINIDNSRRETNLFSTKNKTVINPPSSTISTNRKKEDKEEENKMSRQTQVMGEVVGFGLLVVAAKYLADCWKEYRQEHAKYSSFVKKCQVVNEWAKKEQKIVKGYENSEEVKLFLENVQTVYQKTAAILNRKQTRPFVSLAFAVAGLAVGGGVFLGAWFAIENLLYGAILTGVAGTVVWLIQYNLDSSLEDNKKDAKAIAKAGCTISSSASLYIERK